MPSAADRRACHPRSRLLATAAVGPGLLTRVWLLHRVDAVVSMLRHELLARLARLAATSCSRTLCPFGRRLLVLPPKGYNAG